MVGNPGDDLPKDDAGRYRTGDDIRAAEERAPSFPTPPAHAAHEMHLAAVGSALKRFGSITSPHWVQTP